MPVKINPFNWGRAEIMDWSIDMGQRLREEIIRKHGRRKEKEVALRIGIAPATMSDIVNGISTPSALTLLKLLTYEEIDPIFLLTGERRDVKAHQH